MPAGGVEVNQSVSLHPSHHWDQNLCCKPCLNTAEEQSTEGRHTQKNTATQTKN